MINVVKTDSFGINGLEVNYYTGKEVDENTILTFLNSHNNKRELQHSLMDKAFNPADISGIPQLLHYINHTISRIYDARKIKSPDGMIIDEVACEYSFGVHSFVNCTKKLFSYVVFSECKNVAQKVGDFQLLSITDMFSEGKKDNIFVSEVYKNVFKGNQNSIDLFKIITDIDAIFSSVNMFTNTRIITPDVAAICAIGSDFEQNYKYVLHNHSLAQVVAGLNDFLHDYFMLTGAQGDDNDNK